MTQHEELGIVDVKIVREIIKIIYINCSICDVYFGLCLCKQR